MNVMNFDWDSIFSDNSVTIDFASERDGEIRVAYSATDEVLIDYYDLIHEGKKAYRFEFYCGGCHMSTIYLAGAPQQRVIDAIKGIADNMYFQWKFEADKRF